MTDCIIEKYIPIIGLEVHAQLITKRKIFAPEAAVYGALPNTYTSAITLAHPGTLPSINQAAIVQAIKLGLSCQANITTYNHFDRKNYCYPDLTKGYQITQNSTPIASKGFIKIQTSDTKEKKITLTRIHLEEDTGKSLYNISPGEGLIDYNRAGTPLIEIVTDPVISSGEEAYQYLKTLRKLLRHLDICDGNMEEGSLRCDANISVMKKGDTKWGTKVEVKNMNSMRHVELAIQYEIKRQVEILQKNENIMSATRMYNATTGKTVHMRKKETANDYRYFPEPDISPIVIEKKWLESIQAQMPLLPEQWLEKLINTYQLSTYDAQNILEDKHLAAYYEAVCTDITYYKTAANWILGPIKSYLNEKNIPIQAYPLQTSTVTAIIRLIEEENVHFSIVVQKIHPILLKKTTKTPLEVAKSLGVWQTLDEEKNLQTTIQKILNQHIAKVKTYQNGKKGLLGFFMGKIMQATKGKVNPKKANDVLKTCIENHSCAADEGLR